MNQQFNAPLTELRPALGVPGDRISAPLRRALRVLAVYSLLGLLLYLALRNAPFSEIRNALKGLQLSQIATLLIINVVVITAMTARWWIIVRAENPSIPFFALIGYRLSVFGVSYFTLGPQVGGEALQVLYLQRNHGLTFARATSAVLIDKLLEFTASFLLVGIGAWSIIRMGIFSDGGIRMTLGVIGLAVLLMWPLVHILLLYNGKKPLSKILYSQPFIQKKSKAIRLIVIAERMASSFCRKHFAALLLSLGASVLAMLGIVLEYYLMINYLGMQLGAVQIFAALTSMQIAFLMPIPGGLGALEASQVFVLGAFGQTASTAIGLTLLMRARDILNGGIGLLLAGRGFKDKIG